MLFFDLDGTLVDSSRIWLQIDLDFTARRGLPHTQEYHDFVAHTTAPVAAQFTKDYYHLSESAEEIMAEWYAQALKEYTHHIEADVYKRQAKLRELEALCEEGLLPFSPGIFQLYWLNYEAAGLPAVHHSQEYRKAYAPSYRVIQDDFARFFELFLRIDRMPVSCTHLDVYKRQIYPPGGDDGHG